MTVFAQDLSQIEAVIFDLDGTMVDTLGDFQVALQRTMADLDLPPVSNALIEQTIGKGSEHLIRTLLAHQIARPEVQGLGRTCAALTVDALFERAWMRYQHHYRQINGQFAEALLQQKSLAPFFLHVFGGDSFERKKPDPLPILKTCEALGAAVGKTLMVGDSSNDAQAAHAAGCPVVLVTYGYNHGHRVQDTPAAAWLDTLAPLLQALYPHQP